LMNLMAFIPGPMMELTNEDVGNKTPNC
jgi:hypothetical protein